MCRCRPRCIACLGCWLMVYALCLMLYALCFMLCALCFVLCALCLIVDCWLLIVDCFVNNSFSIGRCHHRSKHKTQSWHLERKQNWPLFSNLDCEASWAPSLFFGELHILENFRKSERTRDRLTYFKLTDSFSFLILSRSNEKNLPTLCFRYRHKDHGGEKSSKLHKTTADTVPEPTLAS